MHRAIRALESSPDQESLRADAWSLGELAGRLCELSGWRASAQTTAALGLVRATQQQGEPAAWIAERTDCFFPPDAAEGGVDLNALVVVRVPEGNGIARAADHLVRSGAFGLIILDLQLQPLTLPMQSRLLGLAHTHGTALVCLTKKPAHAPSLGSLVSLRGEAQRIHSAANEIICELQILKDKRRGPGAHARESCRGSAGLR